MNKRQWNTLKIDGALPTELVSELVRHSYDLVVEGLSRGIREGLR